MNILVTGGASGLGEAITRRIARDAVRKVYFTYNRSEANAKKIESDFPNCAAIKCDFKDEAEVNALTDSIPQLDIDVLINNAYNGSFISTYFHKTATDNFLTEFKDNIIPTIAITQACITLFRKKKQGKIITILTSALGNTPPLGASVYVANKAYLQQLTQVWATENAKYNISSNAISPSFMLTGFTAAMDERIIEQITSNHPLNKLLTTDEVAAAVIPFLNATAQINGINLVINAGSGE
ncbi:MAG TPA: SDR family oxidoreductase [Mucilaginibacter sp.]|nr:SDR family oxidoreductase [Mucilaginibacter sp.]